MKLSALQLSFYCFFFAAWSMNRSAEALTYVRGSVAWPERMQQDGVYSIPYRRDDAPQEAMTRFQWAMNYISRGSNIEFIKSLEYGKRGVVMKANDERYGKECYTEYFSNVDTPVNVYLSDECSTALFIKLLLRILGFHTDANRSDRDSVVTFSQEMRRTFPAYEDMVLSTPYDALSVMHPRTRGDTADIVSPDPTVTELLKYKPMFLTECDWKAVNEKYPGPKPAPATCRPNTLPNVLVPSNAFVELKGRKEAVRLCYVDPATYFDDLMCIVPHGREYPDVPFNEVRYCGSGTVSSENLSRFCSKVTANTKHMTQEECKHHCMESCPSKYPYKPIRDCLRIHYPRCRPMSACAQKKLSP